MKNKNNCKDCEFYRRLNQIGKFKCTVNNKTYTRPDACFMFKKNDRRRD